MRSVDLDELTAFQRDILRVATRKTPCNGQEIKIEIDDLYVHTDISSGRFYPALDGLEDLGLIEIYRGESHRSGNRIVVTDEGDQLVSFLGHRYKRSVSIEINARARRSVLQ